MQQCYRCGRNIAQVTPKLFIFMINEYIYWIKVAKMIII